MNLSDLKNFSENIQSQLLFDYNLKNLNWFNIGGKCKIFFKPNNLAELIQFLKIYNNRGKIFVLGAGSNVLISDETYNGVVIKLGKNFSNISKLSNEKLIAGATVLDKYLADFSSENNIGGLEFLSCIPGTIGGGIRMNAGCYQKEFKDILISIQALDFNGNILTIPSNKVIFDYRSTNLNKELIFLSATFQGYQKKNIHIKEEILKLKNLKSKSQPSKIKTSGSTFKNPIKQSNKKVWELIKASVPKGKSFGDAFISEEHANFFVNKRNASYKDMLKLINFVKKSVKGKFNIDIDLELILLN